MLLEPKMEIIYGPVNSRRLGQSLGLNVLPPGRKACSFNCVYCQYGWTRNPCLKIRSRKGFPAVEDVVDSLQSALARLAHPPAYITFSGNGEPTLHADFNQLVEEVNSIRDHLSPRSKTAILSNSALVPEKGVRLALDKLDVRIMKLDCGHPDIFRKYNQPCSGIYLDEITEGLAQLKNVTIQALFSSGKEGNCGQKNIEEWIERLIVIKPESVQLYTLDRDFPLQSLKPSPNEELRRIQKRVLQEGIACQIY